MSERKIETVKGMCAVAITKFLMQKNHLTLDDAYARFMNMELYQLVMDTDSGMYLEQNDYLLECCEIEENQGADALYEFIKMG